MKIDRRNFVFSLAALAVAPPSVLVGEASPIQGDSSNLEGLSAREKKILGLFCEQIVPVDDYPGARDLGAVVFIERALKEAHPEWILVYKSGLKSTEVCSQGIYNKSFTQITFDEQTEMLKRMERGDLPFLNWNGYDCTEFFAMVRDVRTRCEIPILTMVSFSIVSKVGPEEYFRMAAEAGVDGVIIPDLPPDEGRAVACQAIAAGLHPVFLAAPTSGDKRLKDIVRQSKGFVYYVSLTGITGVREQLPSDLASHLEHLKSLTNKPIAVGFGVGRPDRDLKAMQSLDKYDDSPFGLKVFSPPYTKPDERIGKYTTIPTNGHVYVHSTMFAVAANLNIGRGNRAFELLRCLDPTSNKFTTDGPRPEPIAYPNSYRANQKDRIGESDFAWLTGTAGWLFFLSTENIPGAIPDYDGLRIEPCIPSKWKKLSIRRPFRGAVYEISIRNPKGVQKGVKSVTVDGEPLRGNIIAPHGDGKTHKVEVVMG